MTLPEYLSGERIQGRTTDSEALSGKIAGTSGSGSVYADWRRNSSNDNLSYDLGATLNDTQWIMRFKLYINAFTLNHGSGCHITFGMSSHDADTVHGTSQDSISFAIQFASSASEQDFIARNSSDAEIAENQAEIGTNMLTGSAGKTYYVEIKRTSATAGTVSVTENSDYTTSTTSANQINLTSSVSGLRYFFSKSYDGSDVDNHVYGNISEVKIYDNQSSATTVTYDVGEFMKSTSGWNINNASYQNIVPTSTAKDKSSITNVPIGTRYEEIDTRKIFRRKAGGGAAQNTNLFNLTYSTEKQAAITAGDDPTGKCVVTHDASNPESRAYTTFGTSGNTKTFEIKFTIARGGSDTGNNWGMWLGSDDWDDDGAGGTNKRINVRMSNGNTHIFEVADDDDENTSTSLAVAGTGTTKYYTITGNGTNAKCEYWASSARSGTAESSSGDVSFPTAWLTRDAIDTVTFGGWGGGGNAINVTFSDVSIKWDSGAVDSWVEKGTA